MFMNSTHRAKLRPAHSRSLHRFEALERRDLLAFTDGNVLLLDGIDDEARAAHHASLNVGDSSGEGFTLEASVYVPSDSVNGLKRLFFKDSAYEVSINFRAQATESIFLNVFVGGTKLQILRNMDLLAGWHHIAAVFDNQVGSPDRLSMYVDGALLATTDSYQIEPGINAPGGAVGVGGYFGTGSFPGAMDEVRISNIARYFGNSITVPNSRHTPDANTMALWHFDEAEGATNFADASSSGNTLTGLNGARAGTITVDTEAPRVMSIARQTPIDQVTAADQVVYRVAFSEPVQNVSVADFTLVNTVDSILGESITTVSASSGTTIDVTVSTGSAGNGELRLDILASTATISDDAGNLLQESFTTGESYLIDRPTPELTISDVEVSESAQFATFTLTLSAPAWPGASVAYETVAGTADDDDYQATQGTLLFETGETSRTVSIPLTQDDKYENDEEFFVRLTQPTQLRIGREQGIATILNDDAPPSASLHLSTSEMPEAGGSTTVTVKLSTISELPVQADLVFTGSAAPGVDYTSSATSVNIPAGALEGTITLTAIDDLMPEGHESLAVDLINLQNATPDVVQLTATILDDDALLGDTNADWVVDVVDLNNVRNNFGTTGNVLGDANGDGSVDIQDLNAVRNNFGQGSGASQDLRASSTSRIGHKARETVDSAKIAAYTHATDVLLGRWNEAPSSRRKTRWVWPS